MITHGEDGWLIPLGDVDALAQAIDMLLGDQAMRQRFRDRARDRCRRDFSVGRYLEGVLGTYARALAVTQSHLAEET